MQADQLKQLSHAGTYGTEICEVAAVTFAATAQGELVEFKELPAGSTLVEVVAINNALGSGTTMSYGIKYKKSSDGTDDPDALLAAAASTSAGRRVSAVHPARYEVPIIITGSLGGGAGTGKVSVAIRYIHNGTE